MPTLLQDIRYALRLLVKDRSFTVTVFATLLVCIAANTAIFSIVRSVVLRPLPVPDSEALVLVYNSYPNAGAARAAAAVPDYFDRLQQVPALAEQALLRRESVTVGDAGEVEQLIVVRATPSFFRMLRVQPIHGRVFSDAEGEPGEDARAILSYGFWQRQFGGDAATIGRTVRVNGTPRTIVGIAPPDFTFLWNDVDLFLPAAFTAEDKSFERRHSNNWQMVGRLSAGSTIADVQRQIDALNAANDERFPQFRQILKDAGFHSVAVPLQDDLVRDVRPVLYLLWGGVLFVLTIGCVNLVNLVMVRSSARVRELATRHAMGAAVGRLTRQLLTETMLVAFGGGVAGVLGGWWLVRWLAAQNLDQLPRGFEVRLDLASVAVAFGLALAVGAILGLAPAFRLRRMNLNLELREEGRGGTAGRRARGVRRTLAAAQVAIAFVLLMGAGLLLASFRAVLGLDLGFDPARLHTTRISLPTASYPDPAARLAFFARALDAVRAIPDVEAAGASTVLPFTDDSDDSVILAEGYEMRPGESLISPRRVVVSPGYFESLRMRLVSGRLFDQTDTTGTAPSAIIDERLARKWWPDGRAVGRRLYFPTDMKDVTAVTKDTVFMNVVGVVADVQVADPRTGASPVGTYYLPTAPIQGQAAGTMNLTIRTRTDSAAAMLSVQRTIAAIDPDLPLHRTGPMQRWIDTALVGRRVPMFVALAFGGVGLFLAAIGIFGVLAYGVAERRRELSVRIALGGSAGRVFRLVVADGLRITAIGLLLGGVAAAAVGRLMESQLFGVTSVDAGVYGLVALVLAVVALLASAIPSWRAARIDPTSVLHS